MKTIEQWPQKYNPNYPKFPIQNRYFELQLSWGILFKGFGILLNIHKHHFHLYAGCRYRENEFSEPMTLGEIVRFRCPVHGLFNYNEYLGIEIGPLNIRWDHWKG